MKKLFFPITLTILLLSSGCALLPVILEDGSTGRQQPPQEQQHEGRQTNKVKMKPTTSSNETDSRSSSKIGKVSSKKPGTTKGKKESGDPRNEDKRAKHN